MPNLKPKSPYRLCDVHLNSIAGRNLLAETIPLDLREVFAEITHDDTYLTDAYVSERYSAYANAGSMNEAYSGEFGNNRTSHYPSGMWVLREHSRSKRKRIERLIRDAAQVQVLLELFGTIEQMVPNSTSVTKYPILSAFDRLLFLQAGIGTGKSTMLHHLARIQVPRLNTEQDQFACQLRLAIVDLNTIRDKKTVNEVWLEVLSRAKRAVEEQTKLNTASAWQMLAAEDLYDEKGDLVPDVQFAENKRKAINSLVRQANDPEVYLMRASRYLFKQTSRTTVVLVLDNLDLQPGVELQMQIIDKLAGLLARCPFVLGLVPVREYTLGDLDNQREFHAYAHLNRIHMTTPHLGEMVQKRFDLVINKLKSSEGIVNVVPIKPWAGAREVDLKEVLRHVRTAFAEPRIGGSKLNENSKDATRRAAVFLHHVTNSNARAALKFVRTALQSWALRVDEIITEFYVSKDKGIHPVLPPLTVDELIRLAAVGEYTYFDRANCHHLMNIFCFEKHRPKASLGRFPLLILYRLLQFLDGHPKTSIQQLLEDFKCFGFSKDELSKALELLMTHGMAESKDGHILSNIKELFITRKGWYYLHRLSKMLLYLEHMRNDSTIEYLADPHEVRSRLIGDISGVLDFICYVMEQECLEWTYIRKLPEENLARYKRIVAEQPVCWKLLRGVVRRCHELFSLKHAVVNETEKQQILDRIDKVRKEIRQRNTDGAFWPPIPRHRMNLELQPGEVSRPFS